MGARGVAGMRLMIAYFTQAAVAASQLAGTAHRGLSQSQRENKQRQSTWCLRMPRDVKYLEQEPYPKAPLLLLGFTAVTWKKDRGQSNRVGVSLKIAA